MTAVTIHLLRCDPVLVYATILEETSSFPHPLKSLTTFHVKTGATVKFIANPSVN